MRLGIFGGSFDPVHHGHMTLASCCLEQASLDEVWFVPNARQPLKPTGPHAEDSDRIAMLKLACADETRFTISTLEIDRGGVSYTVDTLAAIRESNPEDELFFLMGADSLEDLPHWHRPEEICRLAQPLFVRRAGSPLPDFELLEEVMSAEGAEQVAKLQVEMPSMPISSSEIRQLIPTGGAWHSMVPEHVAEYIVERQLYQ